MKIISTFSATLMAAAKAMSAASEAACAVRNKRLPSQEALKVLGISRDQMEQIRL